LDKVPKHLAVLFWGNAEEDERLVEIAQLCCWSWCAGVRVLSVYEAEGHLKQNAHLLQTHIENIVHHFFVREKVIPTMRVTALDASINANDEHEDDTYAAKQPDLQVNLLSHVDGRMRIVEVTRSLAIEAIKGNIKSETVDVAEVDRRLSVPQFSEPQLLILFSPKIELDGFPPWHIHLTEIFHVPGNDSFRYTIFLKGLHKYSKCDQRFGR